MLLRERTAVARGFGDDIKLPVLAKLMLAERFIPRLFEQIAFAAAVDPNGLCEDLELFAQWLADKEVKAVPASQVKGQKTTELVGSPDRVVLAEWKTSEDICKWGRLNLIETINTYLLTTLQDV